MMKLPSRFQRIQLFLLLSVVLTLISALVTVYHARQKRDASQLIIHTYTVMQLAEDVHRQLVEMETGQRGYLLTKDSTFLKPFHRAELKVDEDLAKLVALAALPEASELLTKTIIPLVHKKKVSLEEGFDLLHTSHPSAAIDYVAAREGYLLMDSIQQAFTALEKIESGALSERSKELNRIFNVSNIFLYFSFGLIALITILAWLNLRTKQAENEHLVNALREWNLRLEKRVEERTAEVTSINKRLRTLIEEKDNFIGIVSHDLKSPLTGVMSIVKLMKMEGVQEKHSEYLRLIEETCNQMEKLVADILDENRLDQGAVSLSSESVSIKTIFEQLEREFGLMAKQKNISLSFNDSTDGAELISDESILSQALGNLISNALKFSPTGKAVTVRAVTNGNNFVVHVIDEGPGIPHDELPLLFKKFQKLTPRPTKGEGSTGLGLSIVHHLVDLLRGKVEVVSEPGKGSTFSIQIPRRAGK